MTIAMHTSECCSSNERSCGPALQITSDTLQPSPRARARRCGRPTAESGPRRVAVGSNSTAIFAKNLSWQNDTTAPEVQQAGFWQAGRSSGPLAPSYFAEEDKKNGNQSCSTRNSFRQAHRPLGADRPKPPGACRSGSRKQLRLQTS